MNIEPLTASIIIVLGKYGLDRTGELVQEIGPQALDTAKEIFATALDCLCKYPKGELLAEGFQEDPEAYQKPVEKELDKEVATAPDFVAQLEAILEKYEAAAREYAASTGMAYPATLTGNGAIAQDHSVAAGKGGVAIKGTCTAASASAGVMRRTHE